MFEYDVLGSSDVKPADVLSRMVMGGVRPIVAVSERFRSIRRVLKYRPGNAGKEILAEAAEWDADLIVLGMSRASVFSRAVFGTTALHVLRNADRPLFFGR